MRDEPTNPPGDDDEADNLPEAMVCPMCLMDNDPDSAFCHGCGAPIGLVSTLDPVQKILAEGFVYRQAVEGSPKGIILAGIWMLFFPQLLAVVCGMTFISSIHWYDSADAVFGILIPLYGLACAIILYRTTANFIRRRGEDPDSTNEG